MGNMNLNDALGCFRELVDPNFKEFYEVYQENVEYDIGRLSRVYNKVINLCISCNSLADKVAKKLKYDHPVSLIKKIKVLYPQEGDALDRIRKFSNDTKHLQKKGHEYEYSFRKRTELDRHYPDGNDLPEWVCTCSDGTSFELCDSAICSYLFWGKYFAGERNIPAIQKKKKKAN
jgi:hypothetical protein